MLRYLWSCGLLMLPILAWNLASARYLPPQFDSAVFDREIPPLVSAGENGLRMVVFVLPFLMPLDVATASHLVYTRAFPRLAAAGTFDSRSAP